MRISDWSSDVCSSDLRRFVSAESGDIGLRIEPAVGQARLERELVLRLCFGDKQDRFGADERQARQHRIGTQGVELAVEPALAVRSREPRLGCEDRKSVVSG